MRVLIIILLLVLTPLRVWAADNMAVQMATQGLGNHSTVDTSAQASEAHAMQEIDLSIHCAGMADHHANAAHTAEATDTADDEDSSSSGNPCSNCSACQVCATVALIAPSPISAASPQVHHLPWAAVPSFSSAELALGQKPPIS